MSLNYKKTIWRSEADMEYPDSPDSEKELAKKRKLKEKVKRNLNMKVLKTRFSSKKIG